MNEAKPFDLGRRTFRNIERSTIQQDYWLMDRLSEAGIIDLQPADGEDTITYSRRLMKSLIRDGQGFRIIGGLIVPADLGDMDWSPEVADATAEHLKQLTDPGDKQVVHGMLATAYLRFFQDGLLLLELTKSRLAQSGAKTQPGQSSTEPADPTENGPD